MLKIVKKATLRKIIFVQILVVMGALRFLSGRGGKESGASYVRAGIGAGWVTIECGG